MSRYCTFTSWYPSSGFGLIPFLTTTVAGTQQVIDQITRAEGFVDSFIGRFYSPSDIATSPMVTMISEDIVSYRLLNSYVYNTPAGLTRDVKDRIRQDYDLALALLEQIRDGKVELVKSDGTIISQRDASNRFYINTKNYAPTFNLDDSLNWQTSNKRLDDIDSQRDNDA